MIKLTPWQKYVREKAKTNLRLALFAPTGCGKSIASLSALSVQKSSRTRLLVLARKNNLLTWQEEGRIYGIKITPCTTQNLPEGNVVVSHDYAWRILPLLLRGNFNALICDEGYQVQNVKSNRSIAAYQISRKASRCILLNALPFSDQGCVSIFGQYKVLDCGNTFGGSLTQFREVFQFEHPAGFGYIDRAKMLPKLTKMASRSAIFLKRKDCDLPEAVNKTIIVDWHPTQKKVYNLLRDQWSTSFKGEKIEVDHTITRLCKLHQICGGVFSGKDKKFLLPNNKVQALTDLLIQTGNERVVVWCAYSAEIKVLAHLFSLQGHHTAEYTGKSKEFPRKWSLLFAQIRCGVGINDLKDVPYSVFYSRYWNYYYDMQCRGRTARLGSKHKRAFYFSIVLKDSIDELVEKNLKRKNTKAEAFIELAKENLNI